MQVPSTPPKPVTTPQDTPQANNSEAVKDAGCEAYRGLIAKYDWNVETMMYAMQKESSCNPLAVGDNYPINGLLAPSCGLLQVRVLSGRPSCEELKDPATNIAAAYNIWKSQGYRAWSVLH